jgi:hypothetical protein
MFRKIWKVWKSFGSLLGNILARTFLTIFYFTVFIPFGVLVSLFDDRLGIKKTPEKLWRSHTASAETLETARRQS